MYNFSVPMALVDYIPVVFFGIATALLQLDLYGKMRKDAFAMFAAGTINIFAAGFLKATWKLLYAAGICDFAALNTMFLPVQSIGFLLAGIGIVLMLCTKNKVAASVAPPVFSGSIVFISMMVLGCSCWPSLPPWAWVPCPVRIAPRHGSTGRSRVSTVLDRACCCVAF